MASGSTIKIRRSAQAGKIPTTSDLALGELALNTNDGKIFLKKLSGGVEEIVALEKQLTAGTGVTITSGAINIGQNVSTTTSPTFAGAALNGITTITQTVLGKQDPLRVAGYVGSSGSVFTVGVSDTPSDGVTIKSLTSDLSDNAKLSLSGSQIILKTTNKQWSFSDNGNIQLPSSGDIVDSTNTSVLKFPTVKKITFDNPIAQQFGAVPFTIATATDSSNNHITVDDSSVFTVDCPIAFYALNSFGGIQKSLGYPPTVYFIKSIIDRNTIIISDSPSGSAFPISTSSGKMIISTTINRVIVNVYSINGNNNQLTIDDTSMFNVNDPISFYSTFFRDDGGVIIPKRDYGNILINGIYYIRTIVDSTTITITDLPNGAVDCDLTDYLSDTDSPNGPMIMNKLNTNSYQIQRPPRLFTPYDSLETTGYDLSTMTYGDFLWEDPNVYIMVDTGAGFPQRQPITPAA
jgi:hypothetical protein